MRGARGVQQHREVLGRQPFCFAALADLHVELDLLRATLHMLARKVTLWAMHSLCEVNDRSVLPNMFESLAIFVINVAEPLYELHASAFVLRSIYLIMKARPTCTLSFVSCPVLESKLVADLLPLLVMGADLKTLLPKVRLELDGTPQDITKFRNQPHYLELAGLQNFAKATSMQDMTILGILNGANSESPIDLDSAMTLMASSSFTTEIITLAASLHCDCLLAVWSGAAVSTSEALGRWVYTLRMLQVSLAEFESLLASEQAAMVEHKGLHGSTPIALLRNWRGAMATFAGRAVWGLLGVWARILAEKTNICNASTPRWQVSLVGGKFSLPLAEKVLANKLAGVTKMHNELHAMLQAGPQGYCRAPRVRLGVR